jgi:hypothetical protein
MASLEVLEKRLSKEGNPLGQVGIQQLRKFLEGI